MKIITPNWPHAPRNVRALSTTRHSGVSLAPYNDHATSSGGLNLALHTGDNAEHVRQNRARLRSRLPAEPMWLTQIHGTHVIAAENAANAPEADASWTNQPQTICAIMTADCLPVLFCDTAGKTVAAAHAGWRGLANGILENTVQQMRDNNANEIMAWLGPAIGPQKFEVGEDVYAVFDDKQLASPETFKKSQQASKKYFADLYTLARLTLARIGVSHVFGGEYCTYTDAQFYSYRRENVTGRMASLIWLE